MIQIVCIKAPVRANKKYLLSFVRYGDMLDWAIPLSQKLVLCFAYLDENMQIGFAVKPKIGHFPSHKHAAVRGWKKREAEKQLGCTTATALSTAHAALLSAMQKLANVAIISYLWLDDVVEK